MTPTEEMVRVAAEAMWNYDRDGRAFADQSDELKAYWLDVAEAAITAALAAMWQPIETAPKDGSWILISDDVCAPPDLVQWRPTRPKRMVHGTLYMAIPEGWFGSPGGRSRFDVPRDHLMRATRWAHFPPAPTLLSTRMGSEKTARLSE